MSDPEAADGGETAAAPSSGIKKGWLAFSAFITPIAALFIALGEASDATFLLNEMRESVIAVFGNSVEYETLAHIDVGITTAYAEDILGNPQVSKNIDENLSANYFANSKYLLTLFYGGSRVEAYTVVARVDGFELEVDMGTPESVELGHFSFAEAFGVFQKDTFDNSRATSFYLESLESGPGGRFVDIYLGSVSYGAGGASDAIPRLYEADVRGREGEVVAAREALRKAAKPNLYGEGELTLRQIEKSLMTNAEFDSYFGDE